MAELPIVIDNGSFSIKAGFAGDTQPSCIFRTIVGKEKYRCLGPGNEGRLEQIAGKRATELYTNQSAARNQWKWNHPIEYGFISDFNAMELAWKEVFKEMGVDPSQHPVLLTETAFNTRQFREQTAQVMFDTFNVPALFIAPQSELILRTTEWHTACVVDIGEDLVQVVPLYEHYSLLHAQQRMDLAGRAISSHLRRLLRLRVPESAEFPPEVFRILKEQCCYVALKPNTEVAEPLLPSNPTLNLATPITRERFIAPECLFNPTLVGVETPPLPVVIHTTIEASDPDIRKDLWEHVILAGGSSMLPNLKERLELELRPYVPKDVTLHIDASPNRLYGAWIGGSQLAQNQKFSGWIEKEVYIANQKIYVPRNDLF